MHAIAIDTYVVSEGFRVIPCCCCVYRLRKACRYVKLNTQLFCSMLPPSGSNMHWLHPHLWVQRLNSSPRVLLRHLLSFLLLCPFSTSLLSSFHISGDSLRCAVLASGMSLSSWLVLIFPGDSASADGIPRLFVCSYSYVSVYIHLGEEIERKMRIGIKVSIALHYQTTLMRQFELKGRTCSLKSALWPLLSDSNSSRVVFHRIWAETLASVSHL